jgi:uncharacterized protein YjiS (DUF1127 family)
MSARRITFGGAESASRIDIAARARRAFSALLAWQERAAMRRGLARMDDRLLRDIGLTRADVRRELGKPFWRP